MFDTHKSLIGGGGGDNGGVGNVGGKTKNNNDSPTMNMISELDFANSWLTPNMDQLKSLQKILFSKWIA